MLQPPVIVTLRPHVKRWYGGGTRANARSPKGRASRPPPATGHWHDDDDDDGWCLGFALGETADLQYVQYPDLTRVLQHSRTGKTASDTNTLPQVPHSSAVHSCDTLIVDRVRDSGLVEQGSLCRKRKPNSTTPPRATGHAQACVGWAVMPRCRGVAVKA